MHMNQIHIQLCIMYDIECEAGKYGVNCVGSCGEFCQDTKSCDHKDGKCSCTAWGIGELCDRKIGKIAYNCLKYTLALHTQRPIYI